ncbi:hypothetical protein ABT173_18765 [Streptomyces sp. NPDC001795]|uniref:hypothetical protein n=1 Tax=unclassified Streptomyces TaxID=2593676 RepID=UPI0033227316
MSPAPHAPRAARRYAWLRVLVVLVALLATGAHTGAVVAPPAAVSAETCGAECDVLDAALSPTAVQGPRTVQPLRPDPSAGGRPSEPGRSSAAAVQVPGSAALHALRTVVLRC